MNAREQGFTLIEIAIVILVVSVMLGLAVTNFIGWQKKLEVRQSAQEFANVLRLAQARTVGSESGSQYGVYINTTTTPQSYILYQGASYATRTASADQKHWLPKSVQFVNVSLGGGVEIVFDTLTGAAEQSGSVGLQSISDSSNSALVSIASSGAIGFAATAAPSDTNRTKDTRHVTFDYKRSIATDANNNVNETITCTFYKSGGGTVVDTIVAGTSPLISGQVQVRCSATVDATVQTLTIATYHYDDASYSNTNEFSIHRDARTNNRRVTVSLSGDSGTLVDFSADGTSVTYSSTYTANMTQQ